MEENLHLLVSVSKIFSITPIKLHSNGIYKSDKFTVFYITKSILIAFSVVFAVIFRQYWKSIYEATKGPIPITVKFADFNCNIPIIITCLLFTNMKRDQIVEYLNNFAKIRLELEKMGIAKKNKKNGAGISKKIFFFTLLIIIIKHVPYIFYDAKWTLVQFLDIYLFNLPLIYVNILTSVWVVYLEILRYYFQLLNKLLKSAKFSHYFVISDFRISSRKSNEIIQTSCRIYDKLCTQGWKINNAFGWQILLIIPAIFILILFNTFAVCLMIKNQTYFDPATTIYDIVYFLSFLEFVLPCIFVKSEADKFLDNLYEIDIKNYDEDPNFEKLINSVVLQTHHQEIHFTALNVFPLDGTLIYSILGAITTYLVILLQFNI